MLFHLKKTSGFSGALCIYFFPFSLSGNSTKRNENGLKLDLLMNSHCKTYGLREFLSVK